MLQIAQITIDCADSNRLAEFWMSALGYKERASLGQFTILSNASTAAPRLNLQQVPEAKVVKNRVHVDLLADNREAEVKRLVGLGGREMETHRTEQATWTNMADPEGNEFDVVGR